MQDSQSLHISKCQYVFRALLNMQIYHKAKPQAFVRELFFETMRCDDVLDMSKARQAYIDTIDKQDLELVLAFQPPNNARAVESSVHQLSGTVRICLLNGLGWQSQIYHRLVQPVESLLHEMLRKSK
jgi:hypothetical protein